MGSLIDMADQEQELASQAGVSAVAAGGERQSVFPSSVRPVITASGGRPPHYVGGGGSGESTENSARHF